MAPIIKPRVPLYLRQNGPHYHSTLALPAGTKYKEAGDLLKENYLYFMNRFLSGSFCRCRNCKYITRERNLAHEFRDRELRAVLYCKKCSCNDIEYFDNLTPAQEILLDPNQ